MGKGQIDYKLARLRLLEQQAARLADEIVTEQMIWEKFDTDPFKNGDIITWDQTYESNNKTYTFVALKAAGHWYTTGIFQNVRWNWEKLVTEHLSKAVEGSIYKMRKGKQV